MNLDGSLNVLDIVMVADYILKAPFDYVAGMTELCFFATADMNTDGQVDVLDIVFMVDIIPSAG